MARGLAGQGIIEESAYIAIGSGDKNCSCG
jgi:hypothetical protein